MKNKIIALFAVAGVMGILAGLVVVPQMMWGGGSHGSWLIHIEAETLVESSDRIVVATYVDGRTESISKGDDAEGNSKGSITERFRRFTIVEVLKGEGASGDTLHVVATEGNTLRFADGKRMENEYGVADLKTGDEYVLFVEGRSRPAGYPSGYGDVLWISPGEPNLAKVDADGRLTFLATDVYRDLVDEGGLTPVSGSAAPFELTKEGIKQLVAGSSPSG